MRWATIAEGTSLGDLHSTGVVDTIPHDRQFDIVLEPRWGFLAPVADLAGGEWIAQQLWGAGAIVEDVEGKDGKVYVHCKANAVPLIPLIVVVAAIFAAVALLIIAVKINMPSEEAMGAIGIGWVIAIILGIVLIGYLAYKGTLKDVRVKVGGK